MAPTSQQSLNRKVKSLTISSRSIRKSKKPKARVSRYLKSIEPKLEESARNLLLLKGLRCSDKMVHVLKDLRAIQAPNVKLLSKNNHLLPFEEGGSTSLEFLCTKNDCSSFALASNSKKRPNNLILGRTFDRQILDIYELGILRYCSLNESKSVFKKSIGSKPMMAFLGDVWQLDETHSKLRNFLIDFFKGECVDKIVLNGLDHIISFTALRNPNDDKVTVHMRTYFVNLKKNPNGTTKIPLTFLENCGPDMDFTLRRTNFASSELWKASLKQLKKNRKKSQKKAKNQSTNLFGETIGRLHLQKQNLDKAQGKRAKALREFGKYEAERDKKAVDEDLKKEEAQMNMELQQYELFATK